MLYRSLMIAGLAATSAFMAPAMHSKVQMSKVSMGGKGFGGGEATRDPEPTQIDPNDPKGKQQAIHKAESFADYLAKRQAGGGAAPAAAAPAAPAASAPAAAAPPPISKPLEGGKGSSDFRLGTNLKFGTIMSEEG